MDAHIQLHIINFTSLVIMVKLAINLVVPAHVTSLGSGSHSPFPLQVVEFGPISASPGGQLKLKVAPSFGIMPSKTSFLGTE